MSRLGRVTSVVIVAATSLVALAVPANADDADNATYTVKPGDFIKGIALKLGVTIGALLAANDLEFTSTIHPGDAIVVPLGGRLPEAPAAPAAAAQAPAVATTPYVVATGDYLFGIAAQHGVTLGALLAANGLKITSAIQPGQTLAIPPRTLPLPAPPPVTPTLPATPGVQGAPSPTATVLVFLQQQIGKPYRFNAAGPEAFDCSGLVRAGFAQVGVKLPHYSALQSTYGAAVDWTVTPIAAGDLVFTASAAKPTEIGHVGIAIDSRRWIQAPGSGDVVRIGPLPRSSVILAVRRVLSG